MMTNFIIIFTVANPFSMVWLFLHSLQSNTFQLLLMTDNTTTFLCIFYADDMIQWTTGDADGGVGGLGGDPADVGIVADDRQTAFLLPGSNTSDVLTLDRRSNVYMPGHWSYCVDGTNVTEPGNGCSS